MKIPTKMVLVTWYDAHTVDRGGWCDKDELEKYNTPTEARSMGYLIRSDKASITIAASFTVGHDGDDVEQVGGTFVIPRGMINSIRALR